MSSVLQNSKSVPKKSAYCTHHSPFIKLIFNVEGISFSFAIFSGKNDSNSPME